MNKPSVFDDLPLNTDKNFVAGKTKSGCSVIIPVEGTGDTLGKLEELKQELLEGEY